LEDLTFSAIINDIHKQLPNVPKKKLTKNKIAAKDHLNVPNE
jgi:hypothetical protein